MFNCKIILYWLSCECVCPLQYVGELVYFTGYLVCGGRAEHSGGGGIRWSVTLLGRVPALASCV